eukprot:11249551-Prorocentrum_lima.AAC.1
MVQPGPAAPPVCGLCHQRPGRTFAAALAAWPGTSEYRRHHHLESRGRGNTQSCPPGITVTL